MQDKMAQVIHLHRNRIESKVDEITNFLNESESNYGCLEIY